MTLQGSSLFGQFIWNVSGGGNWETDANWTPDPTGNNKGPNEVDATVTLGSSITQNATITITSGGGRTIGSLEFNNSTFDYTLTGNKLKIDVSSGSGTIEVTSGSHEISANIQLRDNTEFNISGSNTLTVSGNIDDFGAPTLTKTGTGTLLLTGQGEYIGGTTVSAGTIILNRDGGNAIIGGGAPYIITINSGGSLLLGSNDQIDDNIKMTLSGGTFKTEGFDETLNNLTLSATSTIDFGGSGGAGDNSVLVFADASSSWSGNLLNITNWTGSSEGDDQLFFGSILDDKLSQVRFVNPAGFAPGTYRAILLGTGEVVPIPEPSAMVGAGLLSGLIILDILRRRRQRRQEEETEAA